MSNIINKVKNNYKTILITLALISLLPVIEVLMKVLYVYGTYVGSYARILVEYYL